MRRALPAVILVISIISAGIAVASSSGGIVESQVQSFAIMGKNNDSSDVRPSGRSAGGTFFFQNRLRSFDQTEKLGRFDTACVLENAKTSLNGCTSTVFLGGGRVELAARVLFTDALKSITFAVVGGTGSYDNVVGQATLTFGCAGVPSGHPGRRHLDARPDSIVRESLTNQSLVTSLTR